jgi:hypothetical protein
MQQVDLFAEIDALVARLGAADWKARETIKAELLALAQSQPDPKVLVPHLEGARKGLPLEARWEVDEVIESLAPPAAPEPEPEPEPEDPNRPLRASDLTLVYDDPRGIRLHTAKKGTRWFLTQPDPYTGQSQMIELRAREIDSVKAQLQGSPYWVPGSGVL